MKTTTLPHPSLVYELLRTPSRSSFVRDQLCSSHQTRLKRSLGKRQTFLLNLGTSSAFIPTDKESFVIHHQVMRLIAKITLELKATDDLRMEDFILHFAQLKRIHPTIGETIEDGIRLFFLEEYLAAAYILTLQLEDLLRLIARQAGQTSRERTRAGTIEKPLGRVLNQLRPILGSNLYHYLYWALKDYRGLNLRNVIAHGLLKKSQAHPTLIVTIIHLLCLLNHQLVRQIDRPKESIAQSSARPDTTLQSSDAASDERKTDPDPSVA